MKVLTLHRPWPWAIFHLPPELGAPKLIENRSWAPPEWLVGQYLGVHAGKFFDAGAEEWICKMLGLRQLPEQAQCIGLVGVVRVMGSYRSLAGVPIEQRRFFFGPIGWVLDSPLALKVPLPMPGKQGLWDLNEHTERAVREELRL